MLKGLIQWVAARGLTVAVYYGFQVLTFVVVFFLAIWLGEKLKMGKLKAVGVFAVVYPLGDLWKRILFWVESGFQVFGGENNVRIFIYVPVIALLVNFLFKIDKKKLCDFLAPCMVITQGVGHWGCIFEGCCQGYPSDWGLYNIDTGLVHFPTQPLEAMTALLIAVYILHRMKKMEYRADGLNYPIMLILFGSTRFIWEFFRDNEKVIWGCSSLALHALLAFVIGIVAYILIRRKNSISVQR